MADTEWQVEARILRLKNNLSHTSESGKKSRIRNITRLRDLIKKYSSEIISKINEEVGKPVPDCEYEVFDTIEGLNTYLGRETEFVPINGRTELPSPIEDSQFCRYSQVLGVVGVITPWNFPFWMPMTVIVPALLTGNSVILKPSEYSTGVGLLIGRIIKEAGMGRFFDISVGAGYTGSLIVQSEDVDAIFFVGSTEAGLSIARNRVKMFSNNFSLEMGGNSAAIIMDDADLDTAVHAVFWQGCYFAGQVCTGAKRILIHTDIYDRFTKRLKTLVDKYNIPENLTKSIGPLIDRDLLDYYEYKVDESRRSGNVLIAGGARVQEKDLLQKYSGGNYFQLTMMEMNNIEVSMYRSESFAPFFPCVRFSKIDEAVSLANDIEYGLSANILTKSNKNIDRFIRDLRVGMVFVNDSEVAYPGGNYWKGSGKSYLSTLSDDKLMAMHTAKYVWEKVTKKPRPYWFS